MLCWESSQFFHSALSQSKVSNISNVQCDWLLWCRASLTGQSLFSPSRFPSWHCSGVWCLHQRNCAVFTVSAWLLRPNINARVTLLAVMNAHPLWCCVIITNNNSSGCCFIIYMFTHLPRAFPTIVLCVCSYWRGLQALLFTENITVIRVRIWNNL